MSKKNFLKLTALSIIGALIQNEYINIKSNINNSFISNNYLEYKSSFGSVKYRRIGSGAPVLLIHNASVGDSDKEWDKIIPLFINRTVYTINLPGCGNSDKNLLQYSNYIFSKVILEFIENVIDDTTDIITSGNSSTAAIITKMSDTNNYIKRLIFINPPKITPLATPDKKKKLFCRLIETPVIGSVIFNRKFTLKNVISDLEKKFCTSNSLSEDYSKEYYNSIHYKNVNSKYMYSSTELNLLYDNIEYLLTKINSFSIITSSAYEQTAEKYKSINPNAQIIYINNCLDYPHIEQSQITMDKINL